MGESSHPGWLQMGGEQNGERARKRQKVPLFASASIRSKVGSISEQIVIIIARRILQHLFLPLAGHDLELRFACFRSSPNLEAISDPGVQVTS